jgi:hypothetical protein
MTPPGVVPTFRPYTAEHLEFGGFYASSCESRVKDQSVVGYALSASSRALASFRSGVSKPSVNQP